MEKLPIHFCLVYYVMCHESYGILIFFHRNGYV
jgi:hypothetical protein